MIDSIRPLTIGVVRPLEHTPNPKPWKETLMNTESVLLRSIGVVLALLMFVALPTSVLAAPCNHCCDPTCELYYGTGTQLFLELETSYPTNATIFFISSYSPIPPGVVPCHDPFGNPCPGTGAVANGTKLPIPYGYTLYVRMLAWRIDKGDSGIVDCDQHNPNG